MTQAELAEREDTFFEALDRLHKGDRVALRRAAGKPIETASVKAFSAFYQCLPYTVHDAEVSRWFASACLHCLWDTDASQRRPLPEIIGTLRRTQQLSDSMHKRVLQIMDTAWSDDGYLLTKIARLARALRQMGYQIDCRALLNDLRWWNDARQRVQRAWARTMFTDVSQETEEN